MSAGKERFSGDAEMTVDALTTTELERTDLRTKQMQSRPITRH